MDHETGGASGFAAEYRLPRRTVLRAAGGTLATGAAVGAFAGTAATWGRFDVDVTGCSELWMVARSDRRDDTLAVAHATTAVDDDIVAADDHPERRGEDWFTKSFSLFVSGKQCVDTPNSPSVSDAGCVQAAYDGHWDSNDWERNCIDDVIGNVENGNNDRNQRIDRETE